jgi:hypothetical protein
MMVLALVERVLTLTLSPEGRGDDGGDISARFEAEPSPVSRFARSTLSLKGRGEVRS